jgi:hypothetical protein
LFVPEQGLFVEALWLDHKQNGPGIVYDEKRSFVKMGKWANDQLKVELRDSSFNEWFDVQNDIKYERDPEYRKAVDSGKAPKSPVLEL